MKWKRPLAILGLVIILAIYVIAIVSAFFHSPESKNWLMAAIFSSVVIPVFLYAAGLVCRVIKPDSDDRDSDEKNGKT